MCKDEIIEFPPMHFNFKNLKYPDSISLMIRFQSIFHDQQCFSQLYILLHIILISWSGFCSVKRLTYWLFLTDFEFEKLKRSDFMPLWRFYAYLTCFSSAFWAFQNSFKLCKGTSFLGGTNSVKQLNY